MSNLYRGAWECRFNTYPIYMGLYTSPMPGGWAMGLHDNDDSSNPCGPEVELCTAWQWSYALPDHPVRKELSIYFGNV